MEQDDLMYILEAATNQKDGIISSETSKVFGKPGSCPYCGEDYILKEFPAGYAIWTPLCACLDRLRDEERAAWQQQQEAKARKERLSTVTEQANLGSRFGERTFDSWVKREGMEEAFTNAKSYAQYFDLHYAKGSGLLFFGAVGTGKSHLAAAICNYLLKDGVVTIFQAVPDLLRRFRATYDEQSKLREQDVMDALIDADLLVLDDIGAEKWGEYSEKQLYQVIDARYRWKRPIVVTTNLGFDPKKGQLLVDCIGERSMDRLIEMCQLVEVKGGSYRKQQAMERQAK